VTISSDPCFLKFKENSMKWHQQKREVQPESLFMLPKIEMFAQGIKGVVTEPIATHQVGQIKVQGCLWRAQHYELSCQATLLPDQPVLAIGRENNTLLVIPYHCLLWDQYMDDLCSPLTISEIKTVQKFESCWRW
jgi:hypothetical protein